MSTLCNHIADYYYENRDDCHDDLDEDWRTRPVVQWYPVFLVFLRSVGLCISYGMGRSFPE